MTTLTVKVRDKTGKGPSRRLRHLGLVPGVLYGEAIKARAFAAPETSVKKLLRGEEKSRLFDLQFEDGGGTVKAIIQDWQADPVSGRLSHLDLYQVRMDKPIHAKMPIHFVGIASAVKDLGGTLVKQIDNLPIECLPTDLIQSVEVAIEPLKTFTDHIYVKNLVLPPGIKVLLDQETILASVAAPRSEAELEALKGEVKADVTAVGLVEKKEKAEEESEQQGANSEKEKKE